MPDSLMRAELSYDRYLFKKTDTVPPPLVKARIDEINEKFRALRTAREGTTNTKD